MDQKDLKQSDVNTESTDDPNRPPYFKKLETEEEYVVARARFLKGYEYFNNNDLWQATDEKTKKLFAEWEILGLQTLLWEIDHDLIPV